MDVDITTSDTVHLKMVFFPLFPKMQDSDPHESATPKN